MNKIKIKNGQRATFKNGASFIHNNKTFDITVIVGGSPYFVSIVTLKKGSEVVKNTFSRLMEGLIEKRGGKDEATFTPIRQTGRGQYSKYGKDHTKEILEAIELFKEAIKGHGIRVMVKCGNESPRGGKLGEYIKVTTFETKKAKLDRTKKAIDGGEDEIWGFKGNVASQITPEQIEEDGESVYDYYYLKRSGGAGEFGQADIITASDDEMNQIIWNR